MSNEIVLVACYHGGNIAMKSNNEPSYEGGFVSSFVIRRASNFEELVSEMYKITGVSREEFELRIVFNCPVYERRTIALTVRNDIEWSNVFVIGTKVTIVELFVEKQPKEYDENREVRVQLSQENDLTDT